MLVKDIISTRWARERVSQQGFYFDSPNLQDGFNMPVSRMVLHMGYIGQNLQAD